MQRAHRHQYVFGVLAQHAGGAIDGEQVAHVELADKLHAHFLSVYLQIHALEVALQYAGSEVCHLSYRVGLHLGLAVLHHYHAVLVVGVGDGKCRLGQAIKEGLLGVAVVFKGLVVVQMVAGEVGEYASGKLESANALLGDGVRRAFHERIFAASLYHARQQCVELYGVGCGVVGGYCLVLDIVADGREQTTAVPHLTEHII